MANAIWGDSNEQEATSPSGKATRGSNTPALDTGVDGDDQSAAVVPPGGKGLDMASPGEEVKISDEQRKLEASPSLLKPLWLPQISHNTFL